MPRELSSLYIVSNGIVKRSVLLLDTNIVAPPLSDLHLARSIGRNTLFGILSNVVQVGTRMITIPVVISHIGLGGYGIWAVVMATASYMRFGSAGIKSAFQKYVAEATGSGDYETASKLLSTGSFLMLGLSLAVLIPMAVFSRSVAQASGVPPQFFTAAAGSITLLALIMVMCNWGAAFDAIVMGGHRIDLARTFSMITTTGEAIAIVALLSLGYGLFAMACVLAVSELVYLACCFVASRRIVPQIRISLRHVAPGMFRELLRFAFSYQLVNILEVLYAMLLPVTILKFFGTDIAGVYALALRLCGAAVMGLDAMILPILSSGTMIFSSGSSERMRRFVKGSFKLTLAIAAAPLAFVAVFGPLLVRAWTGQANPEFRIAIALTCLGVLFSGISRVQLILYRAAGNALHDNIRQAFRLGVLLVLAVVGARIGFYGVLVGLALAESIGVIYMFFALASSLPWFRIQDLIRDSVRIVSTVVFVIAAGYAAGLVPITWHAPEREIVMVRLCVVFLGCAIALWPAITITKSVAAQEQRALLNLLLPRRRSQALAGD